MFDDSRLDDAEVLSAADQRLRFLAEAGARVRAEVQLSAESIESLAEQGMPRAVVAAGKGARLLRAVLESACPVPFVAWPGPGLPGWTGPLDTVVVLAQATGDAGAATAVAEARRRGSTLILTSIRGSQIEELAAGPHSTVLTTQSDDSLAGAVVLLQAMARLRLGPAVDGEEVALALDGVASRCSPFVDSATNPAKLLALSLADGTPLLWGGSALAARAARRIAEAIRRETGRPAFAADVDHLLPVLERTPPKDVFADPFESGDSSVRASVLVVDDGSDDASVIAERVRLVEEAERCDVPVESVSETQGSELARYASALGLGTYLAAYLGIALSDA
ncbi:SIS domain-containing protein [Solicola gregarius]|uniref:Bifunctional glucose-6-phosphate/mannose-6-phosphate isomerase C-terminal domain-containing protein n=1 Tax=Solicola gregarius TaxID=2908642 RepID=A0AA46TGC2_9ACTN|nr:SIS domain-containing protein [Solicola gregarius]UYM04043.1 hypothetical protein L0C25_16015 [Solicola gregarius]